MDECMNVFFSAVCGICCLCCYGGTESWFLFRTGAGSDSSACCCCRCGKKEFDDDDLAQAEAELYQQGVRMEKEKARKSQAGELGDVVNSEQPSRREMIAAIRSSDDGDDDADPARASTSLMEHGRHSRSPSS